MKLPGKLSPILLAAFLIFIFSAPGAAQTVPQPQQRERQVTPIDQGKTDASFDAFREKLIRAVRRRDVKFLLAALDSNVKGSFGGHSGIRDFKALWKLDQPNKSDLWNELLKVLINGGSFSKNSPTKEFCAPYTFTDFPDDLDGFEDQVIFGNDINLRAKPNSKAAIVARLSYNIVRVDYENSIKKPKSEDKYVWLKVKTLGGKIGFVSPDFVRSHVDYRGCFEKQNGVWKMTFFVAGD